MRVTIKNVDNSNQTISVSAGIGANIDGASSYSLPYSTSGQEYSCLVLESISVDLVQVG